MNNDKPIPVPPTEAQPPAPAAATPDAPPGPVQLKRILTPIDFSDASQEALRYASALAAQFQADLILLHVVEFNFMGSDLGLVELSQIEADMKENATKRLKEWRQKMVPPTVTTETVIRSGRAFLEIVDYAREENVDLVLIASHGHSSLAHVLLGSTVERVVRHSACPVMVVRPQEPARSPGRRPQPASG